MAVFDLFSKREQRRLGQEIDVFTYEDIPKKLRVQVVLILNDVLGSERAAKNRAIVDYAYHYAVAAMRRELGVFCLLPGWRADQVRGYKEFVDFLTDHANAKNALDIIELAFQSVNQNARNYSYQDSPNFNQTADAAIDELNVRFKENGVGYQFVENRIIRVDSQLLHAEAVKPALTLLSTADYKGPHEEFINAYDHYKSGNNKEALNDCLKAFESTMKAICDKRGWTYDPKGTASKLIDVLWQNNIIPEFWRGQMGSLKTLLESSIPTGRNRLSGHGQGATPTEVPDEITAYMLHMTASTLVFLTTAEKALPQ